MQVRHILQSKGRDVVAVAADARLIDAAHLLSERRIGALIVKDGAGALAGIISERDLVHAIARRGASALDQPVSAFMTPGPATCVESDTVETIMEVMTHGRFRHVPVLDGTALAVSDAEADFSRPTVDFHRRHELNVQVPSVNGLPAGDYEDVLTVQISAKVGG